MAKQVPARNGGTLTRPEKGDVLNPKGRPKKGWGTLNDELVAEGIEPVSKANYRNVVIRLMSCSEEKLKEIQVNKATPMWIRWIIGDLGSPKTRARLMEDLRNYTLGDSVADLDDDQEKPTEMIITHNHVIMKRDEPSKEADKDNTGEVE